MQTVQTCNHFTVRVVCGMLALRQYFNFPTIIAVLIHNIDYIWRVVELGFSTLVATQPLRTSSICEKWSPNHTHLYGGHWRSCLRAALPLLALPQDLHSVFTRLDRNRLGRSHSPSGGPIYDLPSACRSLAQSFTLWCEFTLSNVRIHNAYRS